MNLIAMIRKGDRQYVALCPELDVVSQGHTIEKALKNIKEAVELYIEEMGMPEDIKNSETILAKFEVIFDDKASSPVRA